MEAGEFEEALRAVDSSISRIKWRLRPSARRRLDTDILALCTGLRPVVMVDYGGKMPELKEHLCMLIHHCHKESFILQHLSVMVIEDMIYLIHVDGLAKHALFIPTLQSQLLFVDLEQDPPKMLPFTEENFLMAGLLSIQKMILSALPLGDVNKSLSSSVPPPQTPCGETSACKQDGPSSAGEHIFFQSSEFIDLSSCMQDTNVTIPTLNGQVFLLGAYERRCLKFELLRAMPLLIGSREADSNDCPTLPPNFFSVIIDCFCSRWLLGYPVVYLFSKEHIADAIYNLSTKPLHLYKIIVCRKGASGKKVEEELMSLSVPYDLSMGGRREAWAEAFLARIVGKLQSCNHVWSGLQLEVTECYPQAVAL